jgi:hypothetical protein
VLTWETRLTRFIAVVLVAAAIYGVMAGAHVTMYYNFVPSMDAREDTLYNVMGMTFMAAIVLSLAHLPLAAWDLKGGRWRAAAMRAFAFVGPVIVGLGAEGLISHFLWWGGISDTDRYHLLHHSVTTALPLSVLYALVIRRAWQPAALSAPANVPVRAVLAAVIGCVMVLLPVGILIGFPSLPTIAVLEALGAVSLLGLWFTRRRAARTSA